MPNHYDVLGISRSASEKEIRQAYRKLAREYHPDVNRGDESSEEKFKQINEAYSVLSDRDKRRKYDRYGDQWMNADRLDSAGGQSRRGGRFHWSTTGGDGPVFDVDDAQGSLFDQLFSNVGQQRRRPANTEYAVELTLEEAYHGSTRLLELPPDRRLEVKIPPGVDNGSRVRVSANAGQRGNIYLVVSVQTHGRFQREGKDLSTEIEIPLDEAILGGETTVATLGGQVALSIPPETQNGQRFRLAGRGMPDLNGSGPSGDLYATAKVILPTGLSEEQLELFRQLREARTGSGG